VLLVASGDPASVIDARPPLTVPVIVANGGAEPSEGEVPLSPPHEVARPVTVRTAASW
jgi:hypothetical protein